MMEKAIESVAVPSAITGDGIYDYNPRRNYARVFEISLGVFALIGIVVMSMRLIGADSSQNANVVQAKNDLGALYNATLLLELDTGKGPLGCPLGKTATGRNNEAPLDSACSGIFLTPSRSVCGCGWTSSDIKTWKGPYAEAVYDPWGNPYYFDGDYRPYENRIGRNGTALNNCKTPPLGRGIPVLVSFGPNGNGSNVYDCDDIFIDLSR